MRLIAALLILFALFKTALRFWKPLADQGYAAAQYNFGLMYANGEGVPQDHAKAMKWYRKAADQGDPGAQNNLGFMYANGQGVPQDHAEAVKWYRKAAEQGYAYAQNNLGLLYGIPRLPADPKNVLVIRR